MEYKFDNEVLISKKDKQDLLDFSQQMKKILDKYKYANSFNNTITAMTRAKNCFVEFDTSVRCLCEEEN